MADYQTPGMYIVEKNTFPGSAVAVETAVPAFIGYTGKASRNEQDLTRVPTRISSMAEFCELFGGAFKPTFVIEPVPEIKNSEATSAEVLATGDPFDLNNKKYNLSISPNHELYFYNCLRFFYLNGGSVCYIISVGSYADVITRGISKEDFMGNSLNGIPNVFDILEKEYEPTMVLLPDAVSLKPATADAGCYDLYVEVLKHCNKTQCRVGIFDVARSTDGANIENISLFRESIGIDFLKYGAGYYPWLKTCVIDAAEINFTNLQNFSASALKALLPETLAQALIDIGPGRTVLLTQAEFDALTEDEKADNTLERENLRQQDIINQNIPNYHQSLLAVSPSYKQIMAAVQARMNLLPPGAAMAGIYTQVDTSRGVWKSPANISVAGVSAPEVIISNLEQENLNVDVISGKSINIIRAFPGIGTLVWGARTLDGNSQDWRYINVTRTMIMIEQSLKLATTAYVFEPNDAGTWVTLQSMLNNFLFNLWKQGALAGATPEQAYGIQVGLGVTMTADDILNGLLRITVQVAIVRPAEFIVITFQQQQQQS